ncbi:TPA: helix-turn-helix transcriptional regulator [Klebsiella pneumoniae]|nr:helix-turn-helix transcriptional regulator [Klebsiella pneumoniae]HBW3377922.1 helix-turn-helix transcriptional regulator [Klebsiella pneumoniae]
MNSNNQVKQLRLQRAWSQEQLAEMAGLSVRTIQRIENGERPGLETLSALAAVFEVTVAEIGEWIKNWRQARLQRLLRK